MVNPNLHDDLLGLHDDLLDLQQRLTQILARWSSGPAPAPRQAASTLFDFSNRMHREKAEAIFDKYQVREKGRAYFYNRVFLAGTLLEDLDAIVERRQAEYRRLYPTAARGRG